MDARQLKIANNMIALAKKRKGKNKRSMMLRTVMPFLSRETGDQLADAIDKNDTAQFATTWNKVRSEITKKLMQNKHGHRAHASACVSPVRYAEPVEAEEAAPIREEEPRSIEGFFPDFAKVFADWLSGATKNHNV